MADRVHPRNSSPLSQTTPSRVAVNSSPPSGAYIIHIPKDQIHRLPPPGNARRYHHHREKTRRCRCCCCLCWFIFIVVILAVLLAVAAAIMYLILRPKAPDYAVESVAVKGMNVSLTSPSTMAALSLWPEFEVTVRADNGNEKIGIYYEKGSSVEMLFNDARLCDGALPAFYQPSNNVTVFETMMTGSGVELTVLDQKALMKAVAKRNVPLTMRMRAPVRVKVGSVKTWKITVKVDCDVRVDELTAHARIVNKKCSYRVEIW